MQIKKYKKAGTAVYERLNDVRFIGQMLFVVIVLSISWSGVKAIQTNYNLQKQITALKQNDEINQLQNDNLKLQNQYYETNQYLELSARANFGLAAPGEKEIIVPEQVAMADTVSLPNIGANSSSEGKQSNVQHNISSWTDFFFHKSDANN